MTVSSFRDLRVWQAAMDLITRVYEITEDFPQRETYGLASQMRRAAISIASNIAEGHAREHTKEYLHHVSVAQGSLAELETQLEASARLTFVRAEQIEETLQQIKSLRMQLFALRNSLSKRICPPSPDP